MSSTDAGTRTTTRSVQGRGQEPVTTGTARSAVSAIRRSSAVRRPTPRTRLCVPRTTSTSPCCQSCPGAPSAARSAATYQVRSSPRRTSSTVRAEDIGALS